jgi:hypothetical protein
MAPSCNYHGSSVRVLLEKMSSDILSCGCCRASTSMSCSFEGVKEAVDCSRGTRSGLHVRASEETEHLDMSDNCRKMSPKTDGGAISSYMRSGGNFDIGVIGGLIAATVACSEIH